MDKYKQNEQRNETFLEEFRLYLGGLSHKTIEEHVRNVSLFLNHYLYGYQESKMEDGADFINPFFCAFFIPKCLWSSPASVRSTAASLKKFYKCMEANKHVPAGYAKEVNDTVKLSVDDWCDQAEFGDDWLEEEDDDDESLGDWL